MAPVVRLIIFEGTGEEKSDCILILIISILIELLNGNPSSMIHSQLVKGTPQQRMLTKRFFLIKKKKIIRDFWSNGYL